MHYLGKILQAAGLTYVAINFLITLPDPLRGSTLAIGGGIFLAGWLVERLKR